MEQPSYGQLCHDGTTVLVLELDAKGDRTLEVFQWHDAYWIVRHDWRAPGGSVTTVERA